MLAWLDWGMFSELHQDTVGLRSIPNQLALDEGNVPIADCDEIREAVRPCRSENGETRRLPCFLALIFKPPSC